MKKPPKRPQYAAAHKRARKEMLTTIRWGITPCCRCRHPLMLGDKIDLDHRDDGKGYLGFSHHSKCRQCGERCNQAAGGRHGGRLRRERSTKASIRSKGRRW